MSQMILRTGMAGRPSVRLNGWPWLLPVLVLLLWFVAAQQRWMPEQILPAPSVVAETAWSLCRALRKRDTPVSPLIVLVNGGQLADLQLRDDLFDDFCLSPFHPTELEARLRHMFFRGGTEARPEGQDLVPVRRDGLARPFRGVHDILPRAP